MQSQIRLLVRSILVASAVGLAIVIAEAVDTWRSHGTNESSANNSTRAASARAEADHSDAARSH